MSATLLERHPDLKSCKILMGICKLMIISIIMIIITIMIIIIIIIVILIIIIMIIIIIVIIISQERQPTRHGGFEWGSYF